MHLIIRRRWARSIRIWKKKGKKDTHVLWARTAAPAAAAARHCIYKQNNGLSKVHRAWSFDHALVLSLSLSTRCEFCPFPFDYYRLSQLNCWESATAVRLSRRDLHTHTRIHTRCKRLAIEFNVRVSIIQPVPVSRLTNSCVRCYFITAVTQSLLTEHIYFPPFFSDSSPRSHAQTCNLTMYSFFHYGSSSSSSQIIITVKRLRDAVRCRRLVWCHARCAAPNGIIISMIDLITHAWLSPPLGLDFNWWRPFL